MFGLGLRAKRFRRRFGVTAPRVLISGRRWWYSGLWLLLGAGLGAALAAAMFWQTGGTADANMQRLEVRLAELESRAGSGRDYAGKVDDAAQRQVLEQVRYLADENAALKEELALFERLSHGGVERTEVRIERFGVFKELAPGRYRYRWLLSYHAGKPPVEFRGRVQLSVTWLDGGRQVEENIAGLGDASGDELVFSGGFVRREGVLSIPPEARLNRVELRVLQGSQVRAKRAAQW